ncbi:MAG: hypothetical protein AB1634_03635, partial [Thermodesulfobacteriota bacterium]
MTMLTDTAGTVRLRPLRPSDLVAGALVLFVCSPKSYIFFRDQFSLLLAPAFLLFAWAYLAYSGRSLGRMAFIGRLQEAELLNIVLLASFSLNGLASLFLNPIYWVVSNFVSLFGFVLGCFGMFELGSRQTTQADSRTILTVCFWFLVGKVLLNMAYTAVVPTGEYDYLDRDYLIIFFAAYYVVRTRLASGLRQIMASAVPLVVITAIVLLMNSRLYALNMAILLLSLAWPSRVRAGRHHWGRRLLFSGGILLAMTAAFVVVWNSPIMAVLRERFEVILAAQVSGVLSGEARSEDDLSFLRYYEMIYAFRDVFSQWSFADLGRTLVGKGMGAYFVFDIESFLDFDKTP